MKSSKKQHVCHSSVVIPQNPQSPHEAERAQSSRTSQGTSPAQARKGKQEGGNKSVDHREGSIETPSAKRQLVE